VSIPYPVDTIPIVMCMPASWVPCRMVGLCSLIVPPWALARALRMREDDQGNPQGVDHAQVAALLRPSRAERIASRTSPSPPSR